MTPVSRFTTIRFPLIQFLPLSLLGPASRQGLRHQQAKFAARERPDARASRSIERKVCFDTTISTRASLGALKRARRRDTASRGVSRLRYRMLGDAL